jgi:hypothetical protein
VLRDVSTKEGGGAVGGSLGGAPVKEEKVRGDPGCWEEDGVDSWRGSSRVGVRRRHGGASVAGAQNGRSSELILTEGLLLELFNRKESGRSGLSLMATKGEENRGRLWWLTGNESSR